MTPLTKEFDSYNNSNGGRIEDVCENEKTRERQNQSQETVGEFFSFQLEKQDFSKFKKKPEKSIPVSILPPIRN